MIWNDINTTSANALLPKAWWLVDEFGDLAGPAAPCNVINRVHLFGLMFAFFPVCLRV